MSHFRRMLLPLFGIIAIMMIVLAALVGPALFAGAAAPKHTKGIHANTHLSKGPVKLPMRKSLPLHPVTNPPQQIAHVAQPRIQSAASTTTSACPAPTLDLKVLILATDGTEVDLPAIKQALDYQGTPYTVYLAAKNPGGLTPGVLSTGCHGFYQGVVLTNGTLSYSNNGAWVSALSQQEWTNLWSYEATMGVRELSWYTYPNTDFGYQPVNGSVDTSTTPLPIKLTTQGASTFSYLNPGVTVNIQNAYTYLAQPLTDGTTTPLFTDAKGNALAAIHTYTDGRQALSLTFDSNPNLLHSVVLSYGLVNWLTKGVFLGARYTYMSAQIDDYFIDDDVWQPTTACGTPVDNTGYTYRITSSDAQAVINWQKSKRSSNSALANTTLTMAFNGYGATDGAYTPDTLTPYTINNQRQFNWVSHTYDHTNLDAVDYNTADSEIQDNNQVATQTLHLTNFSTQAMVTPDVSGLTNTNFLQAAYDDGIRYLVTDTSRAGYNNPAPNIGIYNTYQPSILMIPRYPNNLFYNVATPAGWAAEYNCLYANFWGHNLTYQQILDIESQTLVTYMLKGDMNPWMFHQPNLQAYDGKHTLLGDLLDLTLQKYTQYYNLQVKNPSMVKLGQTMAGYMQYMAAGVTASIVPGVSITLTAQKAAQVPVTGLNSSGAEAYGGQYISHVNLAAGQSVTLPLK